MRFAARTVLPALHGHEPAAEGALAVVQDRTHSRQLWVHSRSLRVGVRVLASLRAPLGNQLHGEIDARGLIGEHPSKPVCERARALKAQGPVRFYCQNQAISLFQIQTVPYFRR